jgi:hypothetical protein
MLTIRRSIFVIALALVSLVASSAEPADAVATGAGPRKALVVYVKWTATSTTPAAPAGVPLSEVTGAVGTKARAWFRAVSHGQFDGWTARGVGPVKITAPRWDDCGPNFHADVMSRAKAAARRKGINPSAFSTTIAYFSRVERCGAPSLSDGKDIWLNGSTTTQALVGKLGQTLQLTAAHVLQCQDATRRFVPLSDDCEIFAYADVIDSMGAGPGSFNGMLQDNLAWLSGRIGTASPSTTTYSLAALEADPVALQVLKVPDGDGTLWLEYRRRIGVDADLYPYSEGVLVHRQVPGYDTRTSFLLDMTPGSVNGYFDAPMQVGVTFTSPFTNTQITVRTLSDAAATVEVRIPTASKVPNVVDFTESQAKSALQASSYVPKVVYQVDDATCDQVGSVMRQSPAGGTTLATGSTVTIYIGKAPATGCAD